MLQLLQILQISLFGMTVLGLFIFGLLILIKPVLILHRRWFLMIFLPLLLANPLALIEEIITPGETLPLNWRLGLVLLVDLGLILAGYWLLRGWQVFGLTEEETTVALKRWLDANGWTYNLQIAERTTWWGGKHRARQFQIQQENQALTFWVTGQDVEVRLQGGSRSADKILRQALPALKSIEKNYHIQDHMAGILFLIMALVLAVLGWIFFFEPRLILIE